jgi:hypothetical protein
MSDRGWIVNTMLDLQATDGEVDAAARAATPAELRCVQQELDMAVWWEELKIRDLRGAIAHIADQNPGLDEPG